jgi:MFS transporter, PAT family, beta-lactamase induction signal transducer AmpG
MASWQRVWQVATTPRVWVVLLLGFSSGLPLALTMGALQAWLTVSGVKLLDIGLFSFVGLPYVYKFLWSPLMDRLIPPFLGRRKGWMLITQFCLLFSIIIMGVVNPKHALGLLAVLALITAFLSASQDIAIDAYRTDLLLPDERGLGSAMFVGGWRIGAMVSGGLALILAQYIGWNLTYVVMALLMLVGLITSLFAPKPPLEEKPPVDLRAAIIEPFKEFLSRKLAVWLLIFIVLYKVGDAFALALASTFFIRGMGFSQAVVGGVFKLYGLIAILLGVYLGGLLMPKIKLYASLFWFGLFQAASNLMFMWLALAGKKLWLLIAVVSVDNLAGGMATAAFLAFLMALCNHKFTATQFALFSALAAVARVFVGPAAAVMVGHYGWPHFFFLSFLLSLPALLILVWLSKKININAPVID